jgi:predicted metal-dependent hydrolase
MRFGVIRHVDGEVLEVGEARVRLRVSRRAHRVSLRVDRATGEVVAIAPSPRRLGDAAAFARERQAWIRERLAELPPRRVFHPGSELIVFGEACRLGLAGGRACLEGPGWELGVRIGARAASDAYARAIVTLLKRRSVSWFSQSCERHCASLGVPLPRISMTSARTRWGSCAPGRRGAPPSIRFSWRLALAPPAIADYVAAHECAHLLEGNHGPRFWAHVRQLIGDERPHRAWLRGEGQDLYGFGG